MENKEDRYKEALSRCDRLIASTRKHIENNRKMLLCYERKKRRIEKLIDQNQGTRLTGAVKKQDIDIEALLEAIKKGELDGFKRKPKEETVDEVETESVADTADNGESADNAIKKNNKKKTNNENTEEENYGNSEHFEDSGSTG